MEPWDNDPLSPVTRTERKRLLVVAAIGLVMQTTGLVPTKITTFGIEFSQADRHLILRLVGGLILYCLVTFAVYAWTDYFEWHSRWAGNYPSVWSALWETVLAAGRPRYSEETGRRRAQTVLGSFGPIARATRVVLEFLFPLAFGIYVATLLLG